MKSCYLTCTRSNLKIVFACYCVEKFLKINIIHSFIFTNSVIWTTIKRNYISCIWTQNKKISLRCTIVLYYYSWGCTVRHYLKSSIWSRSNFSHFKLHSHSSSIRMSYPETYLKVIYYSTPTRISWIWWISRFKVCCFYFSISSWSTQSNFRIYSKYSKTNSYSSKVLVPRVLIN